MELEQDLKPNKEQASTKNQEAPGSEGTETPKP